MLMCHSYHSTHEFLRITVVWSSIEAIKISYYRIWGIGGHLLTSV